MKTILEVTGATKRFGGLMEMKIFRWKREKSWIVGPNGRENYFSTLLPCAQIDKRKIIFDGIDITKSGISSLSIGHWANLPNTTIYRQLTVLGECNRWRVITSIENDSAKISQKYYGDMRYRLACRPMC